MKSILERIPDNWKREIEAGTPFGLKAKRALDAASGLVRTHRTTVRPPRPRELVGTALKARIEGIVKVKSGKGCACDNLASLMDRWGVEGCKNNREKIVTALLEHREKLDVSYADTAFQMAKALGVSGSLKLGARLLSDWVSNRDKTLSHEAEVAGANWLLDRAIEDSALRPLKPVSRSHKSVSHLYKEMLVAGKPGVDLFDSEPVFHFGGHLWPIVGCWEHHVDTWNRLASEIKGRCFVGISECEGCGTSPTSEVVARLSDRFEVFTVPNSKDGENPTFTELLKRIPNGNNDIFLYAHGKGVKPATRVSKAVKVWTQVMYATVIFNLREVSRRMAQGYKVFGSLRAFGDKPLSPKYRWHYAGTFFAVRAKYLPMSARVKTGYGGVEAWPGDNFPAYEAWCEFGDNRQIMSHYDENEMCSGPIEEGVKKLQSMYADRYKHKNLIAVTTCNLHMSQKIKDDLKVLLESIAEHCVSDVVVVDDGSPNSYKDYVSGLCRRRGFKFVSIEKNVGIAAAKNVCLEKFMGNCEYEYCFLLDDDVKIVSPEFEQKYVSAIEMSGVSILSWNDPVYTGTSPEPVGGLVATSRTCGCCVVLSRECVERVGLYHVMPGKWGGEHSEYYRRAVVKSANPDVYLDVAGSSKLILNVSDASVFTEEEKLASNEINRVYLENL